MTSTETSEIVGKKLPEGVLFAETKLDGGYSVQSAVSLPETNRGEVEGKVEIPLGSWGEGAPKIEARILHLAKPRAECPGYSGDVCQIHVFTKERADKTWVDGEGFAIIEVSDGLSIHDKSGEYTGELWRKFISDNTVACEEVDKFLGTELKWNVSPDIIYSQLSRIFAQRIQKVYAPNFMKLVDEFLKAELIERKQILDKVIVEYHRLKSEFIENALAPLTECPNPDPDWEWGYLCQAPFA